MTLQEIIIRVRILLDDTVEPYLWDDFELINYYNDTIEYVCSEAHLIIDSTTDDVCRIALSQGEAKYSADTQVLDIRRVKLSSTGKRLVRTTQNTLDFYASGWETETGVPKYFLLDADQSTQITIMLYPYPGVTELPETPKTITTVTQSDPCAIISATHGFSTGDVIYIADVGGMIELNDEYYFITKVDVDTFTLNGVDSSAYTTYTSGGTATKEDMLLLTVAKLPTILTNSDMDSSPEINAKYHHKLIDGMLARAYMKSDSNTQNPQAARDHLSLFNRFVSEMKRENIINLMSSRRIRKLLSEKFALGEIETPKVTPMIATGGP